MDHEPTSTAPVAPDDLSTVIARFDTEIGEFLGGLGLPENLHDALRYSVLGGGKRLRPALAWYSAVACGGTGPEAIHAGIAVELIHAFSLIHDDLPSLDNDSMRRGRATLHIHAGEAMAVLAGDALLSIAYEAAMGYPQPELGLAMCRELAAGTRCMIAGQVYDTLGGTPPGIDELEAVELIHRNKTGALLRASCRMGAISAGATDSSLEHLTSFAESIGLQFQVIDDLLDVEGCDDRVGKAVGKDEAMGKRTYPGILGIEGSRSLAAQLGTRADASLDALDDLGLGDTNPLRRLAGLLRARNA